MRYMLGDGTKPAPPGTIRGPNGYIDSGDVPATIGPFILWSGGDDATFGFDTTGYKSDDVANFEFPALYRK
jgi:hypothetical protein